MIVLRLTGGIARNRVQHGAAQAVRGSKTAARTPARKARAALDGGERRGTVKGTARPPIPAQQPRRWQAERAGP